MIRKVIVSTGILAAMALPVAADGYDKQFKYQSAVKADGIDWTGFYLGTHSGGVQGKTSFVRQAGTSTPTNTAAFCGGLGNINCNNFSTYFYNYRLAEETSGTKRTVDIDGFHYGPHIGYQKQFGKMVLGADVGFSLGGGEGEKECGLGVAGFSVRCESEYKYSFNARARLGYAHGNFLYYLTGGYSKAKFENTVTVTDTVNNISLSESGAAYPSGYLIGLGLEYQHANGMRFGIGYTHIVYEEVQVRLNDGFGGGSSTRTTPDPDVLGGSLRIPLQQQAPQIQDPGPPAAQAPAVAQAQVAPAARPAAPAAARPAAARPAAPAAAPAAAKKPVGGQPKEPDEPEVKGKPSK